MYALQLGLRTGSIGTILLNVANSDSKTCELSLISPPYYESQHREIAYFFLLKVSDTVLDSTINSCSYCNILVFMKSFGHE